MISINRFISCSILGIVIIGSTINVFAQVSDTMNLPKFESKFFINRLTDSILTLDHRFIVPSSEKIYLDTILLNRDTHSTIDYSRGKINLENIENIISLLDTSNHILLVSYSAFPFQFKETYRHREVMTRTDSSGYKIIGRELSKSFFVDELFQSNLHASGSLLRVITNA